MALTDGVSEQYVADGMLNWLH